MSAKNEMRLASLTAESIDLICRFLNGEKLLALVLTGNRALTSKMRQTRSLTVLWPSPCYCDWNKVIPFISSFPKLKELSLRTSSLLQLQSTSLDLQKLPSHLTLLELRFRGALQFISHSSGLNLLQHLPSLKTLFIEQSVDRVTSNVGKMALDKLPPALEHLHVHVTGVPDHMYRYSTSDWRTLPVDLRTFDVQLRPFLPPDEEFQTILDFGHSGLSSLTHLSANPPPGCIIDLRHVATTLKHLSVQGVVSYRGDLLFSEKPLNSAISSAVKNSWAVGLHQFSMPNIPKRTSVRSILPCLESLSLPLGFILSWDLIETLPLSMTRISAEFPVPEDMEALQDKLARLNGLYQRESGNDRPGAPLMFRAFLFPNSANRIFTYFSNLETLRASNDKMAASTVPRRVRTLMAEKITGDLAFLPPNLTSLTCEALEMASTPTANGPSTTFSSPLAFPSLVSLCISTLSLNSAIVSLLPRTLESLSVQVEASLPLRELKEKAEIAMPRLSSLTIYIPGFKLGIRVETSTRTLPSTIQSLILTGFPTIFEPHMSPHCLRNHPSLTQLNINAHQHSEIILAQLPKQLLHLEAIYDTPFDLNLPSVVADLVSLPPNIHTLLLKAVNERAHLDWLIPLDRLSPNFPKLKRLFAGKNASFFGLDLYLPGTMWSEKLAYALSDNFVLECLPSSLVVFNLFTRASMLLQGEEPTPLLTRLLEWRVVRPLDALKRVIITRLPLLGMHLVTTPMHEDGLIEPLHVTYLGTRINRFPPNLSYIAVDAGYENENLNLAIRTAKRPMRDWASGNVLVARCWYHALNLCTWLPLAYLNRNQLRFASNPVGWSFQWINIIGSAICFPRIAMQILRLGPNGPRPDLAFIIGWSLWLGFSLFSTYSCAVAFNFSGSKWSTATRVGGFSIWLLGEICAQVGLRSAF